MFMPASVGCTQSHRRAWWWGRRNAKTQWLMVCEEDIEPAANAREKLRFIFKHLHENRGQHVMVMLGGADGPMDSRKAVAHSMNVASAAGLVELRSLPLQQAGKNWVSKHVGLGAKWYLLSPEGRDFLLHQRFKSNSFERCIWEHLYQCQSNALSSSHDKPWLRTLYSTPPLGANKRDFDDFFLGSGQRNTDAMRKQGDYISILMCREWPLGQRLATITVGMMLAAMAKIGVVIKWLLAGNSCCDIHIDNLISFRVFSQQTNIAFVKVMREEATSECGVNCSSDAQHEVLRIEEPMALSAALKMVMSFDDTRVTKRELLTSCPAWRAFPLQEWTEHVASAELESKWLPNGLQTEEESWPVVVWLGYQTGSLVSSRTKSSNEFRAQPKTQAMSMQGVEKRKAERLWSKLQKMINLSKTFVILLCGRPGFWPEGGTQWHCFALQQNVVAFGMQDMEGVPPQDSWSYSADEHHQVRSRIVGATMAILCAAPTSKIIAEDDSWTVAWSRNMRLGARDIVPESCATDEPPWKKKQKTDVDDWWSKHWKDVERLVSNNQVERKVLPLHMCATIQSVSEDAVVEANKIANKLLAVCKKSNKALTGSALGANMSSIAELNLNRNKYRAQQMGMKNEERRNLFNWLKAFVMFRLNYHRLENGEPPFVNGPLDTMMLGEVHHEENTKDVIYKLVAENCFSKEESNNALLDGMQQLMKKQRRSSSNVRERWRR